MYFSAGMLNLGPEPLLRAARDHAHYRADHEGAIMLIWAYGNSLFVRSEAEGYPLQGVIGPHESELVERVLPAQGPVLR